MKKILHSLGLDTSHGGLDLRRMLMIDPPNPYADGGGGQSAAIDVEPDADLEEFDFGEERDGDGQGSDLHSDSDGTSGEGHDGKPKFRFKSQEESEEHFRKLQSKYDKQSTRLSALEQQFQSIQTQQTHQRQTDQDTETDAIVKQKAKKLADTVTERTANLDREDPNFGRAYLETMAETLLRETMTEIPNVSRREAQQIIRQEKQTQDAGVEAERQLRALLSDAGLKHDGYLDQAYRELYYLNAVDPTWTQRTPVEDQLPLLVEKVKSSGVAFRGQPNPETKTQRQQNQQQAFSGTVTDSANISRRGKKPDPDEDNPGSTLADLVNNRKRLRQVATEKLKTVGIV